MSCDISFMWKLKSATNELRYTTEVVTGIGNKLTVTRDKEMVIHFLDWD